MSDDIVEIPTRETKAETVVAGDPVEVPALSQAGGTFAERAKARKKAEGKAVHEDEVEDKAVKRTTRKTTTK